MAFMKLKTIALSFFIFVLPVAWSYADVENDGGVDADLERLFELCDLGDSLGLKVGSELDRELEEAIKQGLGIIDADIFIKKCEETKELRDQRRIEKRQEMEEARKLCNQKVEEHKVCIEKMIKSLNRTYPTMAVMIFKELNIKKAETLGYLRPYHRKQYDALNVMLDDLTEGTCSGFLNDILNDLRKQKGKEGHWDFKEGLVTLKQSLRADYTECATKAAEGKSSVACLGKFHDGLLGSTMIIERVLVEGATFEELAAEMNVELEVELGEEVKGDLR